MKRAIVSRMRAVSLRFHTERYSNSLEASLEKEGVPTLEPAPIICIVCASGRSLWKEFVRYGGRGHVYSNEALWNGLVKDARRSPKEAAARYLVCSLMSTTLALYAA